MPARPAAKLEQLAVAVATGQTIRDWAKANGVPESSAYKWSGAPEFKARVAAIQNETVKQAVALLAGLSTRAVATLANMLNSENDKVKLSAAVNLIRLMMDMQSHADLNERITELEKRLHEPESPR